MLLRFLGAQVEATRNRADPKEIPDLLVQAAETAAEKAVALLETMIRQDEGAEDAFRMEDFDMQIPQDGLGDWDFMMPDAFHFADGSSFSTFLG